MLLKTHVEKMSALELAKISMKTKDIDCSCQDMYEKKGTWVKPESKTEMRRASMNPSPRPGRLGTGRSACATYTGKGVFSTHTGRGAFTTAQAGVSLPFTQAKVSVPPTQAGVPVSLGLSTPNGGLGRHPQKKRF
jgi:hypothetical protein